MANTNDDSLQYQNWKGYKLNQLKHNRIICMLLCGHDTKAISKEIGVSQRSIERYFKETGFNENLTQAINLTFKKALAEAALFADRAVQILIDIAENETSTRLRLQAIAQLFEICGKASIQYSNELTDAESRMLHQQKLFSNMRNVQSLMGDSKGLPQGKINIENQKAIWIELYPDEPFPDEETFKIWFENPENPLY